MKKQFAAVVAVLFGPVAVLLASSVLETSLERKLQIADVVFAGRIRSTTPFQKAGVETVYTRVVVEVREVFKGTVPARVQLAQRGGSLKDRVDFDGLSPRFRPEELRLIFASREKDGTLSVPLGEMGAPVLPSPALLSNRLPTGASESVQDSSSMLARLRTETTQGVLLGADVTDQEATPESDADPATRNAGPAAGLGLVSTATNLFTDGGIGARFLAPDRGEPIPYYVDADVLPTGISQSQAITAVKNALDAWAAVTSLRFEFAGLRSFGMASAEMHENNESLHIQLHDSYNFITSGGEVLGRGGNTWAKNTLAADWSIGGNVRGNDFHKVVRGWVILKHSAPHMQNLADFTEVLAHELGHALSLDHSSNSASEANPILKQALMYYSAHGDGRGAQLGSFDINVVRQSHPADNTPPFCFHRYMDVITTPTNKAGLSVIQFPGYDLQTTNLTIQISEPTSNNGTFSASSGLLRYEPKGFMQAPRVAPESNSSYDMLYGRVSDGTNASPWCTVKVVSFKPDNYYEGIADDWRQAYFGSPNPAAGPNRRAAQDFDGDGFSNLAEYRLGSNPTNKSSNLSVALGSSGLLQWEAKPYELYEVRQTGDFRTWARTIVVMPTNSAAHAMMPTNQPHQSFRALKIP